MSSPLGRSFRLLVFFLAVLVMPVLAAGPALSAGQSLKIMPRISLPRAVYSGFLTIYVELSIADDGKHYSAMGSVSPGSPLTLTLKGLPSNRNYILVAKAATDQQFLNNLTVLRALVRKASIAAIGTEYVVTFNTASTAVGDAVNTFLLNTGMDLNEEGIESYLDQITAAADPRSEAIRLSTTSITGKVQDVRDLPISGMTVTVDGAPDKLAQTNAAGEFTLSQVPVRFKDLIAEHKVVAPEIPRYLSARKDGLTLVYSAPTDAGVLTLQPSPQVIHGDIRSAISYIIDNTTGKLEGFLGSTFQYSIVREAPGVSEVLNRSEFLSTVPGLRYYSISSETSYSQGAPDASYTSTFSCAWITRDRATRQRRNYQAQGHVTYGLGVWQLADITLTGEVLLPLPSASATAVGGDRLVKLNWTPSADAEVDGYDLYRNTEDDFSTAQKVNSVLVPKSTTAYEDKNIDSAIYFYWVQCVEEQAGVPPILSAPRGTGAVEVYDSLDLIQQFITAACTGDTTAMGDLLDPGFAGRLPDRTASYGKEEFVAWITGTLFSAGSDLPAKLWQIPGSSVVTRKAITGGSELGIPGVYVVGRLGSTGKNQRWAENETWRVSATTHQITFFSIPSRMYYPLPPLNLECDNSGSVNFDKHADLSWHSPVGDPDPAQPLGYYILRGTSPDWDLATRLPEDGTLIYGNAHTDGPIDSTKTYYYWVVSVDTFGADSRRDENANDYIMVGLPGDIQSAGNTFLTASQLHDSEGVLSVVTSDCGVFRESLGSEMEEYLLFDGFTLSNPRLLKFTMDDSNTYTVYYEITCAWGEANYGLLVLVFTDTEGGVWKIDSIDYTN